MSDILSNPKELYAAVERFGSFASVAQAYLGSTSKKSTVADAWKRLDLPPRVRGTIPKLVQTATVSSEELLRQENKELKAHLVKIREGEVADERVMKRLLAAIEAAEPRYKPLILPQTSSKTPQELVLLFSDTHASEVVSLEETRGMNAYDWQIMEERVKKIIVGVLSHREHFAFPIDKLHVFALGDMLSGDIHEELEITNDRPMAEAIVDFSYLFAWMLEELAQYFKIEVHGVPGNHPRAKKKPSAKLAHNNGDWLAYKFTEAILGKHAGIDFNIRRGSFNVAMVCGRWRHLLMHGDGIRSSMPGVPWGGVHRRITTLEQQFSKNRQPLDYVHMGHWHSSNSLDGIQAKTFMNGSTKGLDEFSLKAFGSGREASQTLLSFHPERGFTGLYPIHLQGVMPASDGWA